MASIPVFLTASAQRILIVGSDAAAMAKVGLLKDTGARLTVIAPGAVAAIEAAGLAGDAVTAHDRLFETADIEGQTLVYISPEDDLTAERARRAASDRGLPVNVIDVPAKSSFTTPARFSRGSLEVAFSSGGAAPVFVRRLRAALERLLPPSLGTLSLAAGAVRARVKTIVTDATARRLFWDDIYDRAGEFADLDQATVERCLIDAAHRARATELSKPAGAGRVQLVGAGPGDPDLLTIKAHRALQQADVIIYDRLVSRDVLALARRDAELVFVGKREGDHGIGQDGIHAAMITHALKGRRVVRLKGGDPMVFARAGEELEALRAEGIQVEVIPGVTALSGIAARTQIPLTDRDYASSITLVTGHLKDGQFKDWARLAGEGRTLAVYMGLKSAAEISAGLIGEGVSAATPVAVIENGTRADERRFYGTLANLAEIVSRHGVASPALLIIGEVVYRAADLNIAAHGIGFAVDAARATA
ncbi:siroheme synthase CysG [Pseudokordiimonas caeni]|uniref:siroheme synthase CysG n=1 Tax=Pseudokordiimonas caeni TaxID=2997908 RepID=UPI002811D5AF|nr:siroheme synthase CysG [Pseudokordiimonas caeni]